MPRSNQTPGFRATSFTKRMEGRVLRYVQRHRALTAGEQVVVAVSGGQDSMALLFILSRLTGRLGIEMAVAHFDHRLRSREEAREDEAAVRGVAAALGLTFASGSGEVRAQARREGESLEAAARKLRFQFLRREARRLKAGVVALGHTRDDRAETVLLHLLRGSGVDGLVGMRPRSGWPLGRAGGPALARPLLEVTRAETLRYCEEVGLSPREDPTNLLLDTTRNRVRHELLPALLSYNPRVEEALCRLGNSAKEAVDYLDGAADAEWRRLARKRRDSVSFSRREFASLAPALRARLLRRATRELAGSSFELEAVHIAGLEEAVEKGRGRVSLPERLTASVGEREVRVAMAAPERMPAIPETLLAVPGRTEVAGWRIETEIGPPPAQPRSRTRYEAWLDAESMGSPIVVRSRRPGDRMRPLGLGGEKKVQDVLVDGKVPEEERDGVPLVCASWGVAWVVGQRLDERAALREGSRGALRLRVRRRPQ